MLNWKRMGAVIGTYVAALALASCMESPTTPEVTVTSSLPKRYITTTTTCRDFLVTNLVAGATVTPYGTLVDGPNWSFVESTGLYNVSGRDCIEETYEWESIDYCRDHPYETGCTILPMYVDLGSYDMTASGGGSGYSGPTGSTPIQIGVSECNYHLFIDEPDKYIKNAVRCRRPFTNAEVDSTRAWANGLFKSLADSLNRSVYADWETYYRCRDLRSALDSMLTRRDTTFGIGNENTFDSTGNYAHGGQSQTLQDTIHVGHIDPYRLEMIAKARIVSPSLLYAMKFLYIRTVVHEALHAYGGYSHLQSESYPYTSEYFSRLGIGTNQCFKGS